MRNTLLLLLFYVLVFSACKEKEWLGTNCIIYDSATKFKQALQGTDWRLAEAGSEDQTNWYRKWEHQQHFIFYDQDSVEIQYMIAQDSPVYYQQNVRYQIIEDSTNTFSIKIEDYEFNIDTFENNPIIQYCPDEPDYLLINSPVYYYYFERL